MNLPEEQTGRRLASHILDARESQLVFRVVLGAFSRPGTVHYLPAAPTNRVAPALLPVLALAGHGTTVAVCGGGPDEEGLTVRATNSEAVDFSDASWVVLLDGADPEILRQCRKGTPVRPDLAAQVSVKVPGRLCECERGEAHFTLRGPGIETERHVRVTGSGQWDARSLLGRSSTYPCGIDLLLVDDGGNVVGIPRSTMVTIHSNAAKEN